MMWKFNTNSVKFIYENIVCNSNELFLIHGNEIRIAQFEVLKLWWSFKIWKQFRNSFLKSNTYYLEESSCVRCGDTNLQDECKASWHQPNNHKLRPTNQNEQVYVNPWALLC